MNAEEIAEKICDFNNSRKIIMKRDTAFAMKIAKKPAYMKANTLVIADPSIHAQTAGIVASQLSETFNKPTIVLGTLPNEPLGKNVYRGSGRSIAQFDLFKAMNPMQNGKHPVMMSFGGHAFACGLTIKADKISTLRKDLEASAKSLGHITPTLKPDMIINSKYVNWKLLKDLQPLEPFGENNHMPLFDVRANEIYGVRTMGNRGKDLSFYFRTLDHNGNLNGYTKVVAFNQGSLYKSLVTNPTHVSIIGTISVNYYRGNYSLQVMAKNVQHTPLNRSALATLYRYLYVLANNKRMIKSSALKQVPLNKKTIKLGVKVFRELHFIHKDKTYLIMNKAQNKQSLLNSKTYNRFA